MIISYDKNFLFCHIPKTAGTSIATVLQPYTNTMEQHWASRAARKILGVNNIPYKMVNFQNYPHWPLLKASKILPKDIFDNLYKFSFVRHPVQWQYSIFRHILRHSEIESFQKRYNFLYKNKDFDEYIRWRIDMGAIPQIIQLIDKNGALMVDDIFHYEKLHSDFQKVCTKINITAELPHFNKNNLVEPVDISQLAKKLIFEHYKIDFDVFGYTETELNKNYTFNPNQIFPELVDLLDKVKSSDFDAWDVNSLKGI